MLLLFLLQGCGAYGFDLAKVSPRLQLGKLEASRYEDLFGMRPRSAHSIQNNQGSFLHVYYAQGVQGFASDCVRAVFLEFKRDLLNAYVGVSSCEDDATTFDEERARGAVERLKGTGMDEVRAWLGKPTGEALCPSLLAEYKERCTKATRVWQWMKADRQRVLGGARINMSVLTVSFDGNGHVMDVELETVQR